MEETTQQFFKNAEGTGLIAQTPGVVRVEAHTLDGNPNAALAAIGHLIVEYEPRNWDDDEMEASDKFYEKVLTLVARHAMVDWNFEPETTVFEAVMSIMATIEKQGGMQITIGDLEQGLKEKTWGE